MILTLKRSLFYISLLSIIFVGNGNSYAYDVRSYTYSVKPGDTLSEITLMFTGNLKYGKVARINNISNPDLIYPNDRITLSCDRPLETLRKYLEAIYNFNEKISYELLATATRNKYSFSEFKSALQEITFFDIYSISACADFITNNMHILQLKIYLEEDPASWGFSLVRGKYKWYILLFDLNPIFPRDNGYIEWKCDQ